MKTSGSALAWAAGVVLVTSAAVSIAIELRRQPARVILAERPRTAEGRVLGPDVAHGLRAMERAAWEEARRYFSRVEKGQPGYLVARVNEARAALELGDWEDAERIAEEVLRLEPGSPDAWLVLARVGYLRGHLEQAEYRALRALEVAPRDIRARLAVAFFRTAAGHPLDAVESYDRALRLAPTETVRQEAERELEQLARQRPDLPSVHYVLAYFARLRGDKEEEKKRLQRYLELDPQGEAAVNARSVLGLEQTAENPVP